VQGLENNSEAEGKNNGFSKYKKKEEQFGYKLLIR
jgi:hypothetical protein